MCILKIPTLWLVGTREKNANIALTETEILNLVNIKTLDRKSLITYDNNGTIVRVNMVCFYRVNMTTWRMTAARYDLYYIYLFPNYLKPYKSNFRTT